MDNWGDIFREFCKFVDERIFPEENAGTYVAFVVDQAFIDDFCHTQHIPEAVLMEAVKNQISTSNIDNLYNDDFSFYAKGIVAIQLYAASKRANSDGFSEYNYRERLSQVLLGWDMDDLQTWMQNYQEDIWETLYDWCEKHYFQITKCRQRTGTGRYVQYPVRLALQVFTEEDLLYIASLFVEKGLSPDEDLQKEDFWKIVGTHRIKSYLSTPHSKKVLENSVDEEDYCDQIFNYFLRWDGEYKSSNKVTKTEEEKLFLYANGIISTIELRNSKLVERYSFNLSDNVYSSLFEHYRFKKSGVILLKKDDVYDNYWQEVRNLEGEEEGILISFKGYDLTCYYKLSDYLIRETSFVRIYKISLNDDTAEFYTTKRPYEFIGGLKIGRHTYLHGGTPVLKIEHQTMLWIDGKTISTNGDNTHISLSHLSVGMHHIKISGYKKIEIEIAEPSIRRCYWLNEYRKWGLSKNPPIWEPLKTDSGIVGLDFSVIPQNVNRLDAIPTTRRWSMFQTFHKSYEGENNIAIKILTDYGN